MQKSYSRVTKVLHWTMAAVIGAAWIAGYYSGTLPLPQKIQADSVMLHKSIATITLFLLAARIPWRLLNRAPAVDFDVPQLERRAMRFGHLLLYTCMISMPLSGWLWSSAAGYKIPVAGLFHLPALMDKTPTLAPVFKQIHLVLVYSFAVLLSGHVLMALKHHFINRDGTLASMLPSRRRGSKAEDKECSCT